MRMMRAPYRRRVRASLQRRAHPLAAVPAAGERRSVTITEAAPAPVHRPLRAVPDLLRPRRPLRTGLVARPRLVRRLSGAPEASVALVVAPAGYGKTTLLRQWQAAAPRPFIWIDGADDAGLQAPLSPSVLVLDDLHAHAPATLDALRDLAGRLSAGSLLVLASRSEPGLP